MMQIDLPSLIAAMRASVEDPRSAARRILAMDLPPTIGNTALAAVAIVTALLTALVSQGAGFANVSPFGWAILHLVGMFISAGLIAFAGRWFGGTGDVKGATLLLAWAQFITLFLQLIQILSLILLPPLAPILALLGIALTFWLMVNFIGELHGFASNIKIFFGILGVSFAAIFVISILLSVVMGAAP